MEEDRDQLDTDTLGIDCTPALDSTPRHKIAIATPAYGEQVHSAYCDALVRTMRSLWVAGHDVAWVTNSLSSIRAGRADLASKALASTAATHIMWIDADVSWPVGAVEKLLAHDLPVVAGVYPKRRADLAFAANLAMKPGGTLRMRGEHLVEVEGIGFGFVLVKREVFEAIAKAHPEKHLHRLQPETSPLWPWTYDFFPDGPTGDGAIMGEDFGFCSLWRGLGGEVWADTSIVLRHHGQWAFTTGASPAEMLAPELAKMEAEGRIINVAAAAAATLPAAAQIAPAQ